MLSIPPLSIYEKPFVILPWRQPLLYLPAPVALAQAPATGSWQTFGNGLPIRDSIPQRLEDHRLLKVG